MPCLLLSDEALVKTIKFKKSTYVGDPINAVRIFNEKEVDELIFLDISATRKKRTPSVKLLKAIASECFMPFTYGGGVKDIEQMRELFKIGVEKVAINTQAVVDPELVTRAADTFGRQSIVVSIDVRKSWLNKYAVVTHGGARVTKFHPVEFAQLMEQKGAGELLLTSIDRDGTWQGFDLQLLAQVTRAVRLPVIACGGSGEIDHIKQAVVQGGASAVAVGSMAVFQGKGLGVLIGFPTRRELEQAGIC